jgi:linear primary-alkylsulfatase
MMRAGTFRGAMVRNARAWSGYLQQTLEIWGDQAEVLVAPHHWPIVTPKEAM